MTIILSELEDKLIKEGIANFSTQEKNRLIATIASKDSKSYNEVSDEYLLEFHKKIKTHILSDTCDELIVGGFKSTNGNIYRTNRDDQLNFIGKMIQLMNDESIDKVMWKTENQGYVEHAREEWIDVFKEGLAHKEQTLFRYNTLKHLVKEAETDEEVVLVEWN
ncbi:tail fiber protein [Bacillus phage vB_BcoS-136]|uniref:DUF4376 domain-containing protein n=1 Tax=Bacillus phage vB_BcoS-136 TaxID=2419619 RepID=A0A3G3BVI1_9CAUD|nr:tail fiber protein [Bacillus phage vB_BcoS-136]AYP68265.1 hypothetical protein vBBcoS136_00151 [Bacillus phage vB_BcoS-136]